MALQSLTTTKLHISPTFPKPSTIIPPTTKNHTTKSRRSITLTLTLTPLLLLPSNPESSIAEGFDFRLIAPDQTLEEAQSTINDHARSLLSVINQGFLQEEDDGSSWKEAQREMRRKSALLKQDIYTIINLGKPGIQRPMLRKMYSNLFNTVSRLDYAARDKDVTRVRECYENIVVVLDDILHRLLP